MINGHVEESLFLVCVEVHGHETVNSGYTEEVSNKFRADADARFAFSVLARPAKIGDDGTDAACGGSFGSINHEEQFHQVVRIGEGALHEKDVASSNAFFIAHFKLSVGEAGHGEIAKRALEFLTDFFCQIA